tara:strand:+ start:204 stop:596 length:393 start_codon:yes stop_codon:yes gene_type:complete
MQEKSDLTAEDVLVQQAKRAFEESVERIDDQTLSKLNRARQTALSELTPRKSAITQWTPLAGLAAATAAAIVFWPAQPGMEDVSIPSIATDMDMLLIEENWEMLENLEFYSWIELEEETIELGEAGNNVS